MVKRAQIDPAIHKKLKALYVWSPPVREDKRGHPHMYHTSFLEQAYNFSLLGATDEQLGNMFGVSRETIVHWYANKPGFRDAVLAGKDIADAKVARALFMRATGYTVTETRTVYDREAGKMVAVQCERHVPPDTTAAAVWLRNRQRLKWANVSEDTSDTPEPMTFVFRPVRTVHVREPSTQPPLTIDAVADDDSE